MKKRVLSALLTLALMLAFAPTAFIATAGKTTDVKKTAFGQCPKAVFKLRLSTRGHEIG